MFLKNKLIIFILFVMVCLTSCDPGKELEFSNNTDAVIKIKINSKPGFKINHYNNEFKGDSIVFDLKGKQSKIIEFGLGTWREDDIDELANSINTFEIETPEIKTIYKTKKAIKKLLEEEHEGIRWTTKIIIRVE